jgi:hypothetical protein
MNNKRKMKKKRKTWEAGLTTYKGKVLIRATVSDRCFPGRNQVGAFQKLN